VRIVTSCRSAAHLG